ncbi:MerR family transcriptional regulator [Campylobacter troglodytis]|uniref:MerR family transcriptional regulator n=1 Tax=Campylobacter troglodytis TaxID=654363 RepID=UPI00115AF94B|nr:MerR family transcriptional regulator [Campylobacter troglodytis]TQR60494.1 MerR family transcriptional regulator [Campylobacter troglodytis]
MSYTIIDVERQTGIASRTLRFWASKGLFPFTQLNEHGTRYFAQSDVEWAQWIECLRGIDMSIEDIRRYLYLFSQGKDTATQRKHLLQRQQIKIEEHLAKLKSSLKKIKRKIAIYEDMEEMNVDLFDKNSKHYYKNLPKYKCDDN